MRYRILADDKGFRAQVELYDSRSKQNFFKYIEDDGSLYSIIRETYYNTEEDAIKACKEHHKKMGYDKLPRVVNLFEL